MSVMVIQGAQRGIVTEYRGPTDTKGSRIIVGRAEDAL